MSYLQSKSVIIFLVILCKFTSRGQPLYPPLAFEDFHNGVYDFAMKEAKVKKKRTYYLMDGTETSKKLYTIFEYNQGGYLVSQTWYNLKSGNVMYSAQYEYDTENYFKSCFEKVTKDLEDLEEPPAKITNDNDFFYNKNGEPESIPADKDSNWVVKTIYQRDSMGNYKAKKYFHDGSFYKDKEHPFWERTPFLFENMYVNRNHTIDYVFSLKMYKNDTIYQSKDTIIINILSKFTNKISHKLIKVKLNEVFVIVELERIFQGMKLFFDYESTSTLTGKKTNEIKSITYVSSLFRLYKCFLIHYFYNGELLPLNSIIELNDIYKSNYYNKNFLDGCFKYTYFKNGQKSRETLISTDSEGMKKFNDIYYTNKNLIYQKVQYRASFGIERSSKLFNHDVDEAVEINEYEYFD